MPGVFFSYPIVVIGVKQLHVQFLWKLLCATTEIMNWFHDGPVLTLPQVVCDIYNVLWHLWCLGMVWTTVAAGDAYNDNSKLPG